MEREVAKFEASEGNDFSKGDGCRHTEIVKELLNWHDGQVEPVICPHCNTENRLPLHFSLDSTNSYILYCQHCGQVLCRKKDW